MASAPMDFLHATLWSTIGLLLTAIRVVYSLALVLLGSIYRGIVRNATLKKVPTDELTLPLLAARLTDLNYQVETPEAIAAGVDTLLTDAKVLHYEEQELMQTNAVWFLVEAAHPEGGNGRCLMLVFRGTFSPTDAITDILIRPETADNGVACHGGFLRTLLLDKVLHATLQKYVVGEMPLYVMGHSLGGALSQTLVGTGMLPTAFKGKLTIVSLGGPLPFYGGVDVNLLSDVAKAARVFSIVNANDIVPRLMGSPLSFTRKLLEMFVSSTSVRKQQRNQAVLSTLEQYNGFPQEELLFVHEGNVHRVPYANRKHVLHLAEALHPCAISDHLSYVKSVEKAAGVPHWAAPPDAD